MDKKQLTPEQDADLKERLKLFEAELEGMQKTHMVMLEAYPQWIPSTNGFTTVAMIGLRDTKYSPIQNPLIQEK